MCKFIFLLEPDLSCLRVGKQVSGVWGSGAAELQNAAHLTRTQCENEGFSKQKTRNLSRGFKSLACQPASQHCNIRLTKVGVGVLRKTE